MPRCIITVCFICLAFFSLAQVDSAARLRGRKILAGGVSAVAAGSALVYLHETWYSDYNTGEFHFFNDNDEWLQMDKAGHFYASYQLSRLMMESFEWAGYSRKTERWVGGTMGLAYLTGMEVMDGYSEGWGFSWGDVVANLAGTGLAITQEALWNEQRLHVKFSYYPSGIAQYNPDVLGSTPMTRLLKDYNAQAYWLSFGGPLFRISDKKFPAWLNISLGYSAYGMTGGHKNVPDLKDENGNVVAFTRERRFLLSLDVDFTKIKTRSKALRGLFTALNVLKLPFPTVSFSQSGIRGFVIR